MKFTVTNPDGSLLAVNHIAATESWARELVYYDIKGFAICQNGELVLLDASGNAAVCPTGRFTVRVEGEDK